MNGRYWSEIPAIWLSHAVRQPACYQSCYQFALFRFQRRLVAGGLLGTQGRGATGACGSAVLGGGDDRAPAAAEQPYTRPFVTRKRDVKQFRQACREAGLTVQECYEASEALHAEKQSSGRKEHMSYDELLAWLREWRQH